MTMARLFLMVFEGLPVIFSSIHYSSFLKTYINIILQIFNPKAMSCIYITMYVRF